MENWKIESNRLLILKFNTLEFFKTRMQQQNVSSWCHVHAIIFGKLTRYHSYFLLEDNNRKSSVFYKEDVPKTGLVSSPCQQDIDSCLDIRMRPATGGTWYSCVAAGTSGWSRQSLTRARQDNQLLIFCLSEYLRRKKLSVQLNSRTLSSTVSCQFRSRTSRVEFCTSVSDGSNLEMWFVSMCLCSVLQKYNGRSIVRFEWL